MNHRKRIKKWNKNQPSGTWRSIKQIRVKYTYILQIWYYEENTYTQKFICPLGMVKYMKKVLKDQSCFITLMSFQILSERLFHLLLVLITTMISSKFDVRMKGTRVMTTATFYSALPAQRTSTQTSSKNSNIICLKTQRLRIFRNIGMNSSLLHSYPRS